MTMPLPPTALVPFCQAADVTREAYLRGLHSLRDLNGNPSAWHCTVCDTTTPGNEILISYNVGDTPIPFCPAQGCSGYGPDLKPTETDA